MSENVIDILNGVPTDIPGQAVLPGLQKAVGKDSISGKLPRRVEDFCWFYVTRTYGNGTRAYMLANNKSKPDSARARAAKLLATDSVRQRIEEIMIENKKRHEILADAIVHYHSNVMSLDRRKALLDLASKNISDELAEVMELEQVIGKYGTQTLIKIPSRHQSAVELSKILGMHSEKLELTGKNGGSIETHNINFYIPNNSRDNNNDNGLN